MKSSDLRLASWLYVGSTAFASLILFDAIPLQRHWAIGALVVYAIAATFTIALRAVDRRIPRSLRDTAAWTVIGFVLVGATVFPLLQFAWARTHGGSGPSIQADGLMIEEGAVALTDGRDPYQASFEDTPLGRWPSGTARHYPYPPGSLLFGLPRALFGGSFLTDVRVTVLTFSAATVALALLLARAPAPAWALVYLVMFALPTGARYAVGGGSDLPPLALMLLSLALFDRGRTTSAGVASGIAICVKHLTLPLAPCLFVAVLRRDGTSAAVKTLIGAVGIVAVAAAPFLVAAPASFVQDVLLFPLGLTRDHTIAHGPTLGRILGSLTPLPLPALVLGLFAAVVVPVAAIGLTRPGWSAARVARSAALITASMILIAAAGRLGYLIYPLNLMVWAKCVFTSTDRQTFGSPTEDLFGEDDVAGITSRELVFGPRPIPGHVNRTVYQARARARLSKVRAGTPVAPASPRSHRSLAQAVSPMSR